MEYLLQVAHERGQKRLDLLVAHAALHKRVFDLLQQTHVVVATQGNVNIKGIDYYYCLRWQSGGRANREHGAQHVEPKDLRRLVLELGRVAVGQPPVNTKDRISTKLAN